MSYPIGSVAQCRFAFTLRALSAVELASFIAGNGLPSGVGTDPTTVRFDYQSPLSSEPVTLTTSTVPAIITDGVGAYHVALPIDAAGSWRYRGYGLDDLGAGVAATPTQVIQATGF